MVAALDSSCGCLRANQFDVPGTLRRSVDEPQMVAFRVKQTCRGGLPVSAFEPGAAGAVVERAPSLREQRDAVKEYIHNYILDTTSPSI